MLASKKLALRRKSRNRFSLAKKSAGRLRLSVHRSGNHIYLQVIDDTKGQTLVSASSLDKDLKGKLKTGGNVDSAKQVGLLLGQRAVKAGITEVVFDRGLYRYHGRVKSCAEGAREAGLQF
ncbi:MAG: 50S ribosomal protein L18 [Alphaproteobacteria bacterium]|nr:MAG: 50S ribosomal protein L18 [Alphaproteobacteria bacterium]